MKKSVVLIIAVAISLVFMQSVFASDAVNKDVFIPLDKEEFTLEEVLWFRPTTYSLDVLQFLQAYLNPDNPKEFFLEAASYTDEQIDEVYVIFQSFFEPEYAGYVQYWVMCDIEAYYDSIGRSIAEDNDPNGVYGLDVYFEEVQDIAKIFPRGIGRTNAYDTFRRCAIHLAVYADRNCKTPGFQVCYDYIQYILSYYDQLFNDAMAAEDVATSGTVTEAY